MMAFTFLTMTPYYARILRGTGISTVLAVYAKKDSDVSVLYTYENETLGSACCLATLLVEGVGICTGYKPLSTPFSAVQNFVQEALHTALKSTPRVTMLGDFNLQPKAHSSMFAFLEDQGFINQLPLTVSTTDKNTAIDIVYSNFEHYALDDKMNFSL